MSHNVALHCLTISKDVGPNDAVEIATRILGSRPKRIAGRDFIHLPKSYFKKGRTTSSKLHPFVTVTIGELKDQHKHLSGSGLFDFLKEGVKKVKAYFSPKLDGYNRKSTDTLKRYGDEVVRLLYLMRTPISGMLDKALNAISFNKWSELKKKYSYDSLYHLAMVADVGNKKVIIEKNETVNISTGFNHSANSEVFHIDMKGKQPTLNELLSTTRQAVGDSQFFEYDAFGGRNCQNFIRDILRSNGLLTSAAEQWLFQPVEQLVKELPAFVPKLAKAITDTAATVNKISGGKEVGNKHSKNIFISPKDIQMPSAKLLVKKQDQLKDRDEVRKIVREQLIEHLEGSGFWDEMKAMLKPASGGALLETVVKSNRRGRPKAAPQAGPAPVEAPKTKHKRQVTQSMKKRNDMVRQLMKTEGMTLPEASKYIKQYGLV